MAHAFLFLVGPHCDSPTEMQPLFSAWNRSYAGWPVTDGIPRRGFRYRQLRTTARHSRKKDAVCLRCKIPTASVPGQHCARSPGEMFLIHGRKDTHARTYLNCTLATAVMEVERTFEPSGSEPCGPKLSGPAGLTFSKQPASDE